ncbi:MAG: hypothetical protein JXB13_15260 [Phycisphaerae bacterium]|nr:hypothetical protein [Phycisphaerae bacterium]
MNIMMLAILWLIPTDIPKADAWDVKTGEEQALYEEQAEAMYSELEWLEDQVAQAQSAGEALRAQMADAQDPVVRRDLERQLRENANLVEDLDKQLDRLGNEIVDFEQVPAELRPLLRQMLDETDSLPQVKTVEDARRLNEFYHRDWGVPFINSRWGDCLSFEIERATEEEDLSPETLRLLREGILGYYQAQLRHHGNTGRAVHPLWMAHWGTMILRVSRPGDQEALKIVEEIQTEAVKWSNELHCWDSSAEIENDLSRAIEGWRETEVFYPSWTAGDVPVEIELRGRAVKMSPDDARKEMIRKFKALERGKSPEKIAVTVRELEGLAMTDWKSTQVNEGMRVLYFFGLRRLLQHEQMPPKVRLVIFDEVEKSLCVCADMDLSGKEWQKWAEAASALGRRAGRRIRQVVGEHMERPGEHKALYAAVWDAIQEGK